MIKKILPFFIILLLVISAWYVNQNPPKPKRSKTHLPSALAVSVIKISLQSYDIELSSFGIIQPRTQSILIPQISGQIISISESFRNGGFFEQGQQLVQLDKREYQAELKSAQADVITANQKLIQEQALASQAKADWKRLGNRGSIPSLVQRQPQIKIAKAAVMSAQAALTKAKLALERTTLIAPFTGRVLQSNVDIGQVVSSGTQLANLYAIDSLEVRLGLKNSDLAYIELPEERLDSNPAAPLTAIIQSDLITPQQWKAQIVRTESAIDNTSQQLHVIAKIDKPFSEEAKQKHPLKVGQYVTAQITGKTIDHAIIIPNSAIYQGSFVYLAQGKHLKKQPITIGWQNDSIAIIHNGLQANDLLVTTPLGQVSTGSLIKVTPTKRSEEE